MTIRTATTSGDSPKGTDDETVLVSEVCAMVCGLTTNLFKLERRAPPALDGYVSELAHELAGVTVDWVRRGPRR